MRRSNRLHAWTAAAALLLVGGGGWLAYRYYVGGMITTLDGREVRDLSVSEVGDLASSTFKKPRQDYLSYLPRYRELAATPIPAMASGVADQVRRVLDPLVHGDGASLKVIASLPPGAADDLFGRVGLVLRVISGMDGADYLEAVRDERLHFDPEAEGIAKYELGRAIAVPADGPRAERDREFQAIFEATRNYDKGRRLATDWAAASEGTRCAAAYLPTPGEDGDVLSAKLSKDDRAFFRGGMSFGSAVCHLPQSDWNQIRATHKTLARFEVVTVIRDRSGDAYPIRMQFYYLPETRRWWLSEVTKNASPFAANAPTFVF